mgnify:CR=1 FL=1
MDKWVFLNGEYKPSEEAKLSIYDHGFLYGDGAFEVIHHDALSLRVLSGRDGSLLLALPRVSSTQVETPVIADLDGDGQADFWVSMRDNDDERPLGGAGGSLYRIQSNATHYQDAAG